LEKICILGKLEFFPMARDIAIVFKKFNIRADYDFCIDGLTLDKIPGKIIEFLIEKNDEFKKYMKNNSGFF
jgi:hypothetical protein